MQILTSIEDNQAVIRAIEENAAELLLAMGRAGGGEEVHEPYIQWTIGGSPVDYHNAVVHADLSQTSLAPDMVIEDVIQQFRARGVPGSWHVGPSMRPSNIGEMLVKHGFRDEGSEPGMAVDLLALNDPIDYSPHLVIERVRDESDLDVWAETLA